MSKFIDNFKKRLESMTQEELDQEWEELKKYNDCGPTLEEYFENLKKYGLLPKDF